MEVGRCSNFYTSVGEDISLHVSRTLVMASVSKYQTIIITTTPKQLRQWAAEMETHYPEKTLGDVGATSVIVDGDIKVRISGDQEAYHKHKYKTTNPHINDWV